MPAVGEKAVGAGREEEPDDGAGNGPEKGEAEEGVAPPGGTSPSGRGAHAVSPGPGSIAAAPRAESRKERRFIAGPLRAGDGRCVRVPNHPSGDPERPEGAPAESQEVDGRSATWAIAGQAR